MLRHQRWRSTCRRPAHLTRRNSRSSPGAGRGCINPTIATERCGLGGGELRPQTFHRTRSTQVHRGGRAGPMCRSRNERGYCRKGRCLSTSPLSTTVSTIRPTATMTSDPGHPHAGLREPIARTIHAMCVRKALNFAQIQSPSSMVLRRHTTMLTSAERTQKRRPLRLTVRGVTRRAVRPAPGPEALRAGRLRSGRNTPVQLPRSWPPKRGDPRLGRVMLRRASAHAGSL